jgi:hypothetical protein
MRGRRATSFHLTIMLKVRRERQYTDSMLLARILVGGITAKIVSEQIPGNTFLLEALDAVKNMHLKNACSRSAGKS